MKSTSRVLAEEIAELVGGRASKNPKRIGGEQTSDSRVTLHRDPFWFTARISEEEFAFDAQHRRGFGEPGSFSVTLFHPWANICTHVLQDDLSKSIGVPVYGIDDSAGLKASSILEALELRHFFHQLKELEFRIFFLHDTQMYSIGPIQNPNSAADRLLMLRDMMETVYRFSRCVNPHFK